MKWKIKKYFDVDNLDDVGVTIERLFKFAIIGWVTGALVIVAIWIGLIWAAIHFIIKYW